MHLQQKLRSQLPCNLLNVVTVVKQGTLTSRTPHNQINKFDKQSSFIGPVAMWAGTENNKRHKLLTIGKAHHLDILRFTN